ncbi:MAG: DUF4296 domain-containing protein [Cyclobacteriaceae bacterium]|nr:DUF4296 domain-containing protein [Cyclobacteriaceae bacterium]
MRIKNFLVILFMLAGVACQRKTRPPGVLSPEEFSQILVELYLAEARMNSTALQRDSAIKLFAAYEGKLFGHFNLPDSTLLKTQQYYVDHPQQLEKIYDSVIDTLSLREKKLRTKPADTLQQEKRTRKPAIQ